MIYGFRWWHAICIRDTTYFGEYSVENFVQLTSDELVIQIRLYSRLALKIERSYVASKGFAFNK